MIRPACPLDIPAISSLEADLFPNSMNERMLHHELIRGRGWVWESDGVKGYILTRHEGGIVDITRIGVHLTAQDQGIGRRLMNEALEGADDAMLTVKKDNEVAIRLYKKLDFVVVGHLIAAGAWVMRRQKNG